jgi:hypothetical protein
VRDFRCDKDIVHWHLDLGGRISQKVNVTPESLKFAFQDLVFSDNAAGAQKTPFVSVCPRLTELVGREGL